jgi:hypothetical protein
MISKGLLMFVMVLEISYCLSLPVDGDEIMNGARQKRQTWKLGPPSPYSI